MMVRVEAAEAPAEVNEAVDARENSPQESPADVEVVAIAKAILDLDELLGVMRRSTPATKTWQRALLARLVDADREIEVLRMTIAMDRSDHEIAAAAAVLQETLALAQVQIGRSRADGTTKVAARMADGLGRQIRTACEAALKQHPG